MKLFVARAEIDADDIILLYRNLGFTTVDEGLDPLSEVRQRLSGILARFRREGAAAEPVAFGSHRKPEAILLSYEVYERYEALSQQRARLDSALASAQSVQAELPGPFSPDHDREVSAYVDGEISAAELYRRTVARYRQP
jgi:hypothetical protein